MPFCIHKSHCYSKVQNIYIIGYSKKCIITICELKYDRVISKILKNFFLPFLIVSLMKSTRSRKKEINTSIIFKDYLTYFILEKLFSLKNKIIAYVTV